MFYTGDLDVYITGFAQGACEAPQLLTPAVAGLARQTESKQRQETAQTTRGHTYAVDAFTVLRLRHMRHFCHEVMQVVQQGPCSSEAEGCEAPGHGYGRRFVPGGHTTLPK